MTRIRPLGVAAAAAIALTMPFAGVAKADVGSAGPSFAGASAPTGEKPQSKLWRLDGFWWAVMFNATSGDFEIYKRDAGAWKTTGTKIDSRNQSWQDVVWDGAHLQVVSAGTGTTSSSAIRYSRLGYDSAAKKYTTEIPQKALTDYGAEVAVLDRDSTGKIWITYTHQSKVFVTHTTTDQSTWATPFVIPVSGADALSSDDISSIVSFNGRIGVMWSDQTSDGSPDAFRWATHTDGQPDDAWQVSTAMSGVEMADDHINLKAIDSDPVGQVFGAVKTSLNRSTDTQIMVLWLDRNGSWHQTPGLRVSDGSPTRAQVAIDRGRRELYLFASEGPCCTGGAIFMKKTSLDSIAFAAGKGTPVIQSSTDLKINNVNTPKEPVSSLTDLPVLASDDATDRYWHTLIPLDGTDISPPETTITTGPAVTTGSTSATLTFTSNEAGVTFACSLDGAPFTACGSPATYNGLAAGSHSFQVRATDLAGNVDATPATRSWTVAPTASVFADGFESGDFSAWTTRLTGADGTAAVQGSTVAVGALAARLSATSTAGSFAYVRKTLPSAMTSLTVSGAFRIDAEGAAGGNVPLLRLYTPGGVRMLTLYRPNGNTKLYVGHSGANFATTGRLPAATFQRIAIDVTAAGTGASTVVVRVEGVEVYRTTTASLDPSGVATVQLGNDTKAQPFVVFADDLEVR